MTIANKKVIYKIVYLSFLRVNRRYRFCTVDWTQQTGLEEWMAVDWRQPFPVLKLGSR